MVKLQLTYGTRGNLLIEKTGRSSHDALCFLHSLTQCIVKRLLSLPVAILAQAIRRSSHVGSHS